jgi:hypothetical protein
MSPWEQLTSKTNAAHDEELAATPLIAEPEAHTEPNPAVSSTSGVSSDSDPSAYSGSPSVDYSDVPAPEESSAGDCHTLVGGEVNGDASENTQPETRSSGGDSHAPHIGDWDSSLPQQLSPEDTTTIARSLVDTLAPAAVESMATSFPVPTGAPADPHVVEGIVARVIERMQPQILEIITREVLRPVVEALVRRQLEQKSPE